MITEKDSYLKINGPWVDVYVKVTPKSKRERVGSVSDSGRGMRLELWVHAPPVDGKANEAVCHLMSKTLGIPPSQCLIDQGHSSRYKTVRLPYNEDIYNALITRWPLRPPTQARLMSGD